MSYLTLHEAATYATRKKGFNVEPGALLRAGVLGEMLIWCAFPARSYYNASRETEIDMAADMLVIPPKHLLEIESEGVATIQAAFSATKEMIFPHLERKTEHLRVMSADLDQLLKRMESGGEIDSKKAIPLKLDELTKRHKRCWPTIRTDIKSASSNGLNVAKAGPRGWHEDIAVEWAKAKGRYKGEVAHNPDTAWISHIHRLEG